MLYFACKKTVRHNSLSQKSHVTVLDKVFNFSFFETKSLIFALPAASMHISERSNSPEYNSRSDHTLAARSNTKGQQRAGKAAKRK